MFKNIAIIRLTNARIDGHMHRSKLLYVHTQNVSFGCAHSYGGHLIARLDTQSNQSTADSISSFVVLFDAVINPLVNNFSGQGIVFRFKSGF